MILVYGFLVLIFCICVGVVGYYVFYKSKENEVANNPYDVVWSVDDTGHVFYRPSKKNEYWRITEGVKMKHISVDKNLVWGIDTNNNIYNCVRPCTGEWKLDPSKKLIKLDAFNNEVWGLDENKNLFSRINNLDWKQRRGVFNNIAVGTHHIWGIDTDGRVSKCKIPCNDEWDKEDILLSKIDVNAEQIWGLDLNNKVFYKQTNKPDAWKRIPGTFKDISLSKDTVWTIDSNNRIFSCKLPCTNGNWDRRQGNFVQIDANKFH